MSTKHKTYVREMRAKKGIGINRLSMLSGVGNGTIMGLEKNELHDPQVGTLMRIAKVLGVEFTDLINFDAYKESLEGKENDR
jgi:transcriptional regulator with XRE-family HTH domain